MKKQLRLVLFVVLVMLLVVASALVASAVTEGSTTKENGHYYQVHTGPRDRQPKYYSTLENAIASIEDDGYTITVLQKVTEQAVTLDAPYAYTIKSQDGARVTFQFLSANANGSLFDVTAGKVTFSGVNFAYAASQFATAPTDVFVVNEGVELVLNDVITEAAVTNTVEAKGAAVVTVSGDETDISGAQNFFKASANDVTVNFAGGEIAATKTVVSAVGKTVTVNVTGGKLIGGAAALMQLTMTMSAPTPSVVTVSGGELVSGNGQLVFALNAASAKVDVKEGAKIYVNNKAAFDGLNAKTVVELNGATFYMNGASAELFGADAPLGTITATAGTVVLTNGAPCPRATWTMIDWSKVGVALSEITLTTGTVDITSADDVAALVAAAVPSHITKLVPGWVTIAVDGATVNVTGGKYTANGNVMFVVKSGTLNLTGGELVGADDTAMVVVEGGTVNYTATKMTVGEDGETFDVQGGTLNIEGAETRLPDHVCGLMLAQGETMKYYTSLANAMAAMTADGAVITIYGELRIPALVLDIDKTYTIKGGSADAKLVFTSTVTAGQATLINAKAGKVTLESFMIGYDLAAAPKTYIAIGAAAADLTVHNMVIDADVATSVFFVNAAGKLTISGNQTEISAKYNAGTDANKQGIAVIRVNTGTSAAHSEIAISGGTFSSQGYIVCFQKYAALSITGGTFTGGQNTMFVNILFSNGSEMTATNATFTTAEGKIFAADFNNQTSPINVTLGTGVKVVANGAPAFSLVNSSASSITLDGATIELVGSATLFSKHTSNADYSNLTNVTVTSTSGTVVLGKGAAVPDVALDSVVDWTKIKVDFTEYEATFEIAEAGVYIFNTLEEYLAIAQAQARADFETEYKTRFPLAELQLSGWIPLTLNHADAVVNIISGNYITSGSYFFKVMAGTLNIRNATFTADKDAVIVMEGGTLNVIAGTLNGSDGGKVIDHKAGNVYITGGTLNAGASADSYIIYTTAQADNNIYISGGTLNGGVVICVAETATNTVNFSGGLVNKRDGATSAVGIQLYSANATVNISGGEMKNMYVVLHVTNGYLNISGGSLKNDTNGSHILNVDGPAKVNITNGELILMTVNDNIGAINISSNAAEAEVDISGGGFGGVDGAGRNYMNPININAAIKHFNVSGGKFVGGRSGGGVVVRSGGAGAVLNFSGDCLVGAYRALYIQAVCEINISGGTFTKRPYSDQQNYIAVHATKAATINVSGGQFTEIMIGFYLADAATLNITGGVFDTRTLHENSGEGVYAVARVTGAAKVNVGPNTTGGVDPVFNLKRSATKDGKTIMDLKGFVITNAAAELKIAAGVFNIENANNIWFDFPANGIATFEITGGTYNVVGEGASFVPASMDKPGTIITGATVRISGGASLPVYNNIDTTTLHIVVEGAIIGDLIVRKPFGGEDPDQKGFVVSTPADLYNVMAAQFASFVADPTAFTTWLPMLIDGDGVIVTLQNVNDVYALPTLVKVNNGTLKVNGGNYVAQAGEKLFEVVGDATVQITGGEYNVSGVGSYLIYIADGVDASNISVENAKMTVGAAGDAQLQASFNVSDQQVTVNGMAAIELTQAGNYTISQISEITALVQAALESKFANLVVSIDSWVPLHLNNDELTVTITGGNYTASALFMFKVTAGTLKITGGKFTNDAGDIIQIDGANAVVEIDLPNTGTEDPNGMYTTGRIIYAKNASAANVTVKNGRFVELAYDASDDQKDALFVFDGTAEAAALTIQNGYFEATRILLVYYVPVTVTIEDGTFVSNVVVDGTKITARPTNAHMLSPRGTGATLIINGGSFDNKQGNYIIAQNGNAGAATTINAGTFNGGSGWYISNYATTLTINGGTFTDTEGYANNHYMYLNNAATAMTIKGGTFTGTIGTSDIFHIAAGQLNITNGSFTGSLFHITTASAITVSGGTYKATGIGGVLFEFIANGETQPTSANFNLTAATAFAVENYATILDTTMDAATVKTLLNNASYVINGSVRLGITVDVTANEVWETPAAAQKYIRNFFGASKVTFGTAGAYALQLRGNYTITIKGGDYRFPGTTLFKLYGVDMIIEDGVFYASEGGDVIYLEGDSNITIGKEFDKNAKPTFVVGFGGNIIHANASPSTFLIYNGSFYKGILNEDGSVTPVIDFENYTSPLIYLEKGSEYKPTLIICDGYFEATRVLMDYYAYGETIIYGGVFKSNFNKQMLTEIYGTGLEYDSKGGPMLYDGSTILYDSDKNYLLCVRGNGAKLTIYGGTYNGGYSRAIVGLAGQGGTTFNFYGGDFTGGYNWFFTNYGVTVNMAAMMNPWTEVVSAPTFRAPDSFTRYGFYFNVNAADKHVDLTISDGAFSMTDTQSRYMFVSSGDLDINVSGGSFTINPGSRYDATSKELQNDSIIFTSYATATDLWMDLTITGGNFTAPRIVLMSNGRGHLVITGGNFTSNAEACDDSNSFYSNNAGNTIYISGGNFVGNKYQYHHVYITGAENQELTIVGGSFSKGLRWIYLAAPNMTVTFDKTATTAPQFKELSDGTGVDLDKGKKANVTVYGMYIHRNCAGSEINFNYGNFVLPVTTHCTAMFVVEGGNIHFREGMKVEHPNRIFQITNAFIGNITFTGGTYTSTDVCNMFYITVSMANATTNGGLGEARILIEDGTFNAMEDSTMFHLLSQVPQYEILIRGGKFFSENARMFFYDGTGMTVNIEDGDFSTTAARLIYLDNNTTPMFIKGGTFTFLPKSGNNTDNGLIYAAGKNPSVITIQGGTFIDQRIGNKQTFIKMNPRAVINFAGDFKMYVLEKKDNFFYDYDDNTNSLPITKYASVETLDGEDYYVCFGYYREFGPIMTTTPSLRAVLGAEGITYSATISAATLEYLQGVGTVSYGMLIFPTEYLNDGEWNNDTDFLADLKAYAADNGKDESSVYVDIVADKGKTVAADGSVTYYASLINIKEKNYNRAMTGIAYVKVVDAQGNVTYHYATHVSASVTQDMRTIAKAALFDLDTKPWNNRGRVYCYATIMKEGMYFSRYTPAQQDSLRKFLAESDRMPKHDK